MALVLFYLALFVFGCIIGSFINVLIDRGENNEQVVKGRSYCDHCKKSLEARDLVPVISFISLGGKCRYCKDKLSYYYPIVELTTGFLFAVSSFQILNITPNSRSELSSGLMHISLLLIIVTTLITIFFADIKYGIIPLKAVILGVVVSLFWNMFYPFSDVTLLNYFLSGTLSFLSFLLIHLITKGKGMGMGDVIYVFLMGLLLGFPKIVIGFYIAFISGAIISLILVFLKKKKIKGGTIPFGPFLVAGTYISLLWGDNIIDFIMTYLLR
jgi:leader peptidase (prepilin peptidase) / N-methyltransferase